MSASSSDSAATLRVRAALANLRRDASHAAELVSQLVLGEEAVVIDERPGWLRVAGRDGYPGWVDARALVNGARAGAETVWTRRAGVLHEGPAADGPPLCDLTLGARAEQGDANTVRLPDGRVGWSDGDGWIALSELPERLPRDGIAIVATALSLRGIPYLWGGTSSKAFDCSGFVQRVFRLHGVELPRDAWQQAGEGLAVDAGPAGEHLQPADLLFFAEGGGRVTHVAVALGGDGRFVHSSTARAGVGVDGLAPADPLHAPGLAATLVACRRVL